MTFFHTHFLLFFLRNPLLAEVRRFYFSTHLKKKYFYMLQLILVVRDENHNMSYFLTFPVGFWTQIIFSNLNSNWFNVLLKAYDITNCIFLKLGFQKISQLQFKFRDYVNTELVNQRKTCKSIDCMQNGKLLDNRSCP